MYRLLQQSTIGHQLWYFKVSDVCREMSPNWLIKTTRPQLLGKEEEAGFLGPREEEGTWEEGMVFLLLRERARGMQDVGQGIV